MKIALFTDTFLPQVNGIVTSVVSLAEGLAEAGHSVTIVAPKYGDYDDWSHHPNIRILRLGSVPALFYEGFRLASPLSPSIWQLIATERVDLIHFHTPITLGGQAILLATLLGIPLVGTYHTLIADPLYLRHAGLNTSFMRTAAWLYSRLYYNRCDIVSVPSLSAKTQLMDNGMRQQIEVISNGVAVNQMCDTRSSEGQCKCIRKSKRLLYVGRIAHEKNLEFLMECFRSLLRLAPSTKLIIVGDGPQRNRLEEQIIQLKLSKHVKWLGMIPHARLMRSSIYKLCDVFITASTTETQGLSVLEAQSRGMPCVGIRAGGISELIRHERSGLLVAEHDPEAFAQAVARLLADHEFRNHCSENARKDAARHDAKHITQNWVRLYRGLIQAKAARTPLGRGIEQTPL